MSLVETFYKILNPMWSAEETTISEAENANKDGHCHKDIHFG